MMKTMMMTTTATTMSKLEIANELMSCIIYMIMATSGDFSMFCTNSITLLVPTMTTRWTS